MNEPKEQSVPSHIIRGTPVNNVVACQFESLFLQESSGPKMAECAMLRPILPMSTFRYKAGISEMMNGDRHAARELVSACLSGSEEAWTEFYRQHHGLVQTVVKRHTPSYSPAAREDLTQEVYESLVTGLETFDGHRSSLKTFVSMVASRTCIDWLRGRSRMRRKGINEPVDHHGGADPKAVVLQSNFDPPDELLTQAEYRSKIKSALNRLADACRELLRLRFYADLTYAEIAAEVGKKENTVTVAIRRCLAQLRAACDDLDNEGLKT